MPTTTSEPIILTAGSVSLALGGTDDLAEVTCDARGSATDWLRLALRLNGLAWQVYEHGDWDTRSIKLCQNWCRGSVTATAIHGGVMLALLDEAGVCGEEVVVRMTATRDLELRVRIESQDMVMHQLGLLAESLIALAESTLQSTLGLFSTGAIRAHFGVGK